MIRRPTDADRRCRWTASALRRQTGVGGGDDDDASTSCPDRAGQDSPGAPIAQLAFARDSLAQVRRLTAGAAARARLSRARCEELVLAVDELATNSVVHGGGHGELKLWPTPDGILCEVRDRGHIVDPLAGRRAPHPEQLDGRGLWVVRHLCDQMDVRSSPGRTVVRVHMRR